MDAVEAVRRLGGAATARQICALSSRGKLRTALRHGQLSKLGRRTFVLAEVHQHRRPPAELSGVTSHLSA